MSFLTMDDFKGIPMNRNCSPFEALLEVARVASLKLNQEILDNSKENVSKNIKKPSNPEQRKLTSLKRIYDTLLDDKDCILDQSQQVLDKKKKKLNKKQKKQLPQVGPNPPPDLPDNFKKKIEELGGSELTLLIQKSLYFTDLSPQHNRLSLPLIQIKNPHFLREQESLLLMNKNQALDIVLIEPSLHTRNIVFGKWDLAKSSSYILRSCWIKVANANGLKANDIVQVWSFRVQQKLCMALVKLPSSN